MRRARRGQRTCRGRDHLGLRASACGRPAGCCARGACAAMLKSHQAARLGMLPCERRRPPPQPSPPPHSCPPLATPAAIHETPFGEFIPLSNQAGVPVLVRLHERQWGALARLPAAKLTEAGFQGARLGVCFVPGAAAAGASSRWHGPAASWQPFEDNNPAYACVQGAFGSPMPRHVCHTCRTWLPLASPRRRAPAPACGRGAGCLWIT